MRTLLMLACVALVACDGVRLEESVEPAAEREQVAVKVVETFVAGDQFPVLAECPDEHPALVSGGCTFGGYLGSIRAVASTPIVAIVDGLPVYPAQVSGWSCTGYMPAELADGGDPGAGAVTAIAICQ